jgi:HNH endonuclease
VRSAGVEEFLAIVGGLAVLVGVFYVVSILTRAKEVFRFRLRRTIYALLLYAAGVAVLRRLGYSAFEMAAFSFLLALSPLAFMRPPKRTRYIPKHVKRAVIARDLKGQPFNPRTHHIDHIQPFSKGGDHSVKNLRVVAREYNLRRGAKRPTVQDFLGSKPGLRSQTEPHERTAWGRLVRLVLLVAALALIVHFWPKR